MATPAGLSASAPTTPPAASTLPDALAPLPSSATAVALATPPRLPQLLDAPRRAPPRPTKARRPTLALLRLNYDTHLVAGAVVGGHAVSPRSDDRLRRAGALSLAVETTSRHWLAETLNASFATDFYPRPVYRAMVLVIGVSGHEDAPPPSHAVIVGVFRDLAPAADDAVHHTVELTSTQVNQLYHEALAVCAQDQIAKRSLASLVEVHGYEMFVSGLFNAECACRATLPGPGGLS